MGSTATTNGNTFLRLSSRLMGLWASRSKLYLLLWVDSCPQKWMNPFHTLKVGLTSVSQSRLRGCTPKCCGSLGTKSPVEPGSGLGVRFGIAIGEIKILCQDYFANTCANSPIRIHPLPLYLGNALCACNTTLTQDVRTDRHMEGTALMDTHPDNKFGVEIISFGKGHRDFGV